MHRNKSPAVDSAAIWSLVRSGMLRRPGDRAVPVQASAPGVSLYVIRKAPTQRINIVQEFESGRSFLVGRAIVLDPYSRAPRVVVKTFKQPIRVSDDRQHRGQIIPGRRGGGSPAVRGQALA